MYIYNIHPHPHQYCASCCIILCKLNSRHLFLITSLSMRKFYIGFLKYARSRGVEHDIIQYTLTHAHVHKFCVVRWYICLAFIKCDFNQNAHKRERTTYVLNMASTIVTEYWQYIGMFIISTFIYLSLFLSLCIL